MAGPLRPSPVPRRPPRAAVPAMAAAPASAAMTVLATAVLATAVLATAVLATAVLAVAPRATVPTAAAGVRTAPQHAGVGIGPPGRCGDVGTPAAAVLLHGGVPARFAVPCPEVQNTFTFRMRRGATSLGLSVVPAGPVISGTTLAVRAALVPATGAPAVAWIVVTRIGSDVAPAVRVPVAAGVARGTVVMTGVGRALVSVEFPATRRVRAQAATCEVEVRAPVSG